MARASTKKIVRRLIPFLCLLFIVNYLDRTNVAMAKLQMLGDAHLTEASYGLGAGLFFIGYFLFEVPSNLILQRVGARRWIARIMISWGILSAMMMLVRGTASFYALRFAAGDRGGGIFPGDCVLSHRMGSGGAAVAFAGDFPHLDRGFRRRWDAAGGVAHADGRHRRIAWMAMAVSAGRPAGRRAGDRHFIFRTFA